MEIELNCEYEWVNKTHETVECTPMIGFEYAIVQIGIVLLLTGLIVYGIYKINKWLEDENEQ